MKHINLIAAILCLMLLFYNNGFRISFSPFKITFIQWYEFVGILLILIGIGFISYQRSLKVKETAIVYYKQGLNDAYDNCVKAIEEAKFEVKNNKN